MTGRRTFAAFAGPMGRPTTGERDLEMSREPRPCRRAALLRRAAAARCWPAARAWAATRSPPARRNAGDAAYATSPANIASLTEVVTRNPKDPQAYNMRGTVFGQGAPLRGGARRLQQGDRDRSQLRAGLCQSRAGLSRDRQARSRARRLRQGDPDRRALLQRLSRPRHGLPRREQAAAGLGRLQQGDRHPPRQRAGLLQPRPALSGAGPAQLRDRGFHHRHRAVDQPGRRPISRAA